MLLRTVRLGGKGRSLVAAENLAAGTHLLSVKPIAKAIKKNQHNLLRLRHTCQACLKPLTDDDDHPRPSAHCSSAQCKLDREENGAALLARCDLQYLDDMQLQQDRRFPIMCAQLVAALLESLRSKQSPPESWISANEMCYAILPSAVHNHLESERRAIVSSFVNAGVSNRETLELLLPSWRYARLIGAMQLNAFGLTLSERDIHVVVLLPQPAFLFNHSCDPNVHVSLDESCRVDFVLARDAMQGDELCISYVDVALNFEKRQEMLLNKYGFTCDCQRCKSIKQ